MASVLFYSDPHLWLQRKANSTASSSVLREEHVRSLLTDALTTGNHTKAFCLGDFFDRANNPEKAILAGAAIAEHTDIILAGNHDVLNRIGACSSLEVILELYPDKVVLGDNRYEQVDNSLFCFVPHQLSQESFHAALDEAVKTGSEFNGYRILCLHCNYDLTMEVAEEALVLHSEKAAELLGTFHYILIGHDHSPRTYFDGRLRLLGSIYPSTLGEAETARAFQTFDTSDGTWSSITSYDPAIGLWSGKVSEFTESQAKFFSLLDTEEGSVAGQKLALSLFKEGAFAVKVSSNMQQMAWSGPATAKTILSLPEIIRSELKETLPSLLPLWEELTA